MSRFGKWRVLSMAAVLLVAHRPEKAAAESAHFSAEEFERHVRILAADDLEGRGIGTAGLDRAAEYIAARFEEWGVAPGGDGGGYFQSFEVSVSSRIADATRLRIGGRPRRLAVLSDDFVPLPMSRRGGFDGPVVFVGYGMRDPERDYDDYAGQDVRGKALLMLRYEPGWASAQPVDEQDARANPPGAATRTSHAYFETKIGHAVKAGAAAILIVNPLPAEGGTADVLYDFSSGRARRASVPMLHVTRALANEILEAGGQPSVAELQRRIEERKRPCSGGLGGVRVNGYVAIASDPKPVKNVVGVVRGKGPLADEYVVVGAHYDHLGVATNWRKPGDPKKYVHNGADDNASGTTGLMLIARAAAEGPPLKRSLLFIAFTAEESGLLGSRHWVRNPTVPVERVAAMINLDMIGRLRNEMVEVGGMKTGSGFEETVMRLSRSGGLTVRSAGGGRGPSDHAPFFSAGIPVLFFFTGLHREYHAPEDDADLVEFDGARRVASLALACAAEIANAPQRPEYFRDTTGFRPATRPGDPGAFAAGRGRGAGPGAAGDGERPAMPRVRLGVAPGNYGEAEGRGLPIEYVAEGGPAAKAGLRDGDRILRVGDEEISDIYSFMGALRERKPGDVIEVRVQRGEEELTFRVTLEGAASRGRPGGEAGGRE